MRKSKLMKELIRRRNEVISRAKHMAQGLLPDDLLIHGMMDDFIMWVIEPFTCDKFEIYNHDKNDLIARNRLEKEINKTLGDDIEKE